MARNSIQKKELKKIWKKTLENLFSFIEPNPQTLRTHNHEHYTIISKLESFFT